jgi:hypothetical protein
VGLLLGSYLLDYILQIVFADDVLLGLVLIDAILQKILLHLVDFFELLRQMLDWLIELKTHSEVFPGFLLHVV